MTGHRQTEPARVQAGAVRRAREPVSAPSPLASLTSLQRQAGNNAVAGLFTRSCPARMQRQPSSARHAQNDSFRLHLDPEIEAQIRAINTMNAVIAPEPVKAGLLEQVEGGAGLPIAAGTPISVRFDGGASIPKLKDAAGQGVAAFAAAANIQAIHASSYGIEVIQGAKPVAHIDQLTIHRGGTVRIDKISLQGEAADAARSERGFWTLVGGILGAEQHRENPFYAGEGFSTEPVVVPGFVKGVLERKLQVAFTDLLKTHGRSLIPGVDLGSVLGVRGGPPVKAQ